MMPGAHTHTPHTPGAEVGTPGAAEAEEQPTGQPSPAALAQTAPSRVGRVPGGEAPSTGDQDVAHTAALRSGAEVVEEWAFFQRPKQTQGRPAPLRPRLCPSLSPAAASPRKRRLSWGSGPAVRFRKIADPL